MQTNRSPLFALLCVVTACSSSSGDGGNNKPPPAFTLHYHRPAADYAGWTAQVSAGAVETSATSARSDGFGAVYDLTVKDGASTLSFTLASGAANDPAGSLSVDVSGTVREAWVISGFATAVPRTPPALPDATHVALYYKRADDAYTGWGLHLWGDQVTGTSWGTPLQPAGIDADLGAGFVIPLAPGGAAGNCPVGKVCVIVHKGDTKDPGPDMSFSAPDLGNVVFILTGSSEVTSVPRKPGALTLTGMAAHLLSRDTLAWKLDAKATQAELRWSATADIAVAVDGTVTGGATIALTPIATGVEAALLAKAPYVEGFDAFSIAATDLPALKHALKGQLVAVARDGTGKALAATQVQTAWALDDLYAYEGPLGVAFAADHTPTFRLWAPTAQSVKLHVYDGAKAAVTTVDATAGDLGLWTVAGDPAWYGDYYTYELSVYHPLSSKVEDLTTTDPYAVNLSTNGTYAQIIDLADPALKPAGWDTLVKPALASVSDIVLYEGHVRDFSALDPTVPAARRGKFLGFVTEPGAVQSDGLKHLAALAAAGLTHLHLLPIFDVATIDEDPANRVDIDQPFADLCAKNAAVPSTMCTQFAGQTILQALASLAGDSDQQQAIAGYMRNLDSFNWGYDPFHYGAPEGSYASTADGYAKVVELRQMVQGLAAVGLRVVMDVVYNHTNASGPASDKSVLDKVVPGYYHRLDPATGFVLTSTCCANTATEHRMMQRLMVDTAVRWARDYKIDGFRFDLMGHHLKQNMVDLQAALAALTPAADGVDGAKIYVYGEGWDFGEMKYNARGVNATQLNMAGTGIGTFNDRVRDGVRGGSPFDSGNALISAYDQTKSSWGTCSAYTVCGGQGFATGLFFDSNEKTPADTTAHDVLLADTDWIRASMAGNLADFRLQIATGQNKTAGGIGYSGVNAAYTAAPSEAINYVAAHDNQDLWDIIQYKVPTTTSTADRVRVQNVALDTVLLGEGIPFVHMGDDLLRSKSEDKNSYDSGDWFNRIDWSGASNNWKVGVPPQGDNSADWPLIEAVFALGAAYPAAADIAAARAHFIEMLKVRESEPLLRLQTAADVKKRVDFQNVGASQVPGLIVMTVTDGTCAGADLDPARDAVVIVINADRASHDVAVAGASGFTLHPVLAASADATVRTASFGGGTFTVPARTSAVFEQLQSGAQGTGLPCNSR